MEVKHEIKRAGTGSLAVQEMKNCFRGNGAGTSEKEAGANKEEHAEQVSEKEEGSDSRGKEEQADKEQDRRDYQREGCQGIESSMSLGQQESGKD
jgi:hypothetical protein